MTQHEEEKLDEIITRLDVIEKRGHLPAWLLEILDPFLPGKEEAASETLSSVMRDHEKSIIRGSAIYYFFIGGFYLWAAISFQASTSIDTPLKAILSLFYFFVAFTNLSCIRILNLDYQIRMVFPTVGAAAVALVVSVSLAIQRHQTGMIAADIILWGFLIIGHIGWGVTTPGRVKRRALTLQFIKAIETKG